MRPPTLHLIVGPNGAGKSTLYATAIKTYFPDAAFVNADLLAREKFGHHANTAEEVAYGQAAATALRLDLLRKRLDLVAETVFSHPSKLELVRDAKTSGYQVWIYHVHVETPTLSIKRIARRVAQGGHDVPTDKAVARYARNQPLIRDAIRLADRAFVFDNSVFGQPPRRILEFRHGVAVFVADSLNHWAQSLFRDDLI